MTTTTHPTEDAWQTPNQRDTDHPERITKLARFVYHNAYAMLAVSMPLLALSLSWVLRTYQLWADFQVYRWGVHTWLDGGDVITGLAPISNGDLLNWVYPPFALLPLAPFALPPLQVGVAMMYTANLLCIGAVLYLVIARMWPAVGKRGALGLSTLCLSLSLFLEPVHACFGQAQINIALMGMVIIDCLARWKRWPRGILIGIAAAIKIMPLAFLLLFVVRKDYRAAVTTAATAVVCTGIGFAIYFSGSLDYWFRHGPAAPVAGYIRSGNQSILATLARLDAHPVVKYGAWIVVGIALLVILIRVIRKVELPLAVIATGLFALLMSPTSWSNHWVWMVPAIVLMFGYAMRDRSLSWQTLGTATVLIMFFTPFASLPSMDGRELLWSNMQQLTGNSYVWLGIVALIGFGLYAERRVNSGAGAPQDSGAAAPQDQRGSSAR